MTSAKFCGTSRVSDANIVRVDQSSCKSLQTLFFTSFLKKRRYYIHHCGDGGGRSILCRRCRSSTLLLLCNKIIISGFFIYVNGYEQNHFLLLLYNYWMNFFGILANYSNVLEDEAVQFLWGPDESFSSYCNVKVGKFVSWEIVNASPWTIKDHAQTFTRYLLWTCTRIHSFVYTHSFFYRLFLWSLQCSLCLSLPKKHIP